MKFLQFFFQPRKSLENIRELRHESQSPHIGPLVYGGHAADHDVARNALGNSGFGSDGYIVTDMQMSGNAYPVPAKVQLSPIWVEPEIPT